MTNKTNDDFFTEENKTKAGWFKFEKIGDTIKGVLIDISDKPEHGNFPAQKIYTLKTDKEVVNVGFSVNKVFVLNAMKNASVGQIVGFKYESDYQTDENKKKGMNPAKTIGVYLGDMDTAYAAENPTDVEVNIDDIPFK